MESTSGLRASSICKAASGRPVDDRTILASFSVLYGLIAAVLSGYHYGLSNHAEQLPIIFRFIDPGYLANDFFVNTASEFGPRFYYSHALAVIAVHVPLPAAAAVLWVTAFVAVAVITAFTARDLSGSVLGGMIAVVLVTLPAPFALGNRASVFDPLLVPSFLAMPFALFAVWKGVRGQPVHAAIASIPAVLFHPVMGIEIVGLALAAAGANRVFLMAVRREYGLSKLWSLAPAILIAGLTSLLWIVPAISTRSSFFLETDAFVHIYAYFRHPHHLVPSTWDTWRWALGAAFTVVVVTALIDTFRTDAVRAQGRAEHLANGFAITTIFVVIAAALLVGYIFVEIFPTRIAVTAQTFRMTSVVAWLGWILIAGLVAELLVQRAWRWAALFVTSAVIVPTLFVYKGVTFFASRLKGGSLMRSTMFFKGVTLLIVVTVATASVVAGRPTISVFLLTALGFVVILMIAVNRRLATASLAILGGVLVLAVTSLVLERYDILPSNIAKVSLYLAQQPILTLDEAMDTWYRQDHNVDLATVAKDTTDTEAVFLVPWEWAAWRLLAERAIVVDRKAFPFRDGGMREWYERYLAIYDEGAGYPDYVTESELLDLQRRYGFHYAALPVGADMPSFPVLASSGDWKLVHVADVVPK